LLCRNMREGTAHGGN